MLYLKTARARGVTARRRPPEPLKAARSTATAGLWEFPGGKVEPGERPEEALIRELREELSIEVQETCLAPFTFASHLYPEFHLLMPLFVCRRWSGVPIAQVHQAIRWVRP